MPRVEHISNMNANHIYALNAKVMYTHHGPRMTTAIIEDEDVQSKIKILLSKIQSKIIPKIHMKANLLESKQIQLKNFLQGN